MRPHSRYRVDRTQPRARGVCDRCGFQYQLTELHYQYQWAGSRLQNLQRRVCENCLDIPQEQLRAIILPPDPLPVEDPRVELYTAEVPSPYVMFTTTSSTSHRQLVTAGSSRIFQLGVTVTPTPDPRVPFTYANAIPT